MAAESTPHHPAIAAFLADHRDTLEGVPDGDWNIEYFADAFLNPEQEHSRPQEASE